MDHIPLSLIVVLALVLAIIVAIVYLVMRVRRAAQDISRLAFGHDDLVKGFQQAEAEYASTPKSLSSMTSLVLPQIQRDFREFNYDDMARRARNVIVSYLCAVDQMDQSQLSEGNSELKEQLRLRISMLDEHNQREQFQRIETHRLAISRYEKKNGRCLVTFQCSLQSKHALLDANGNVLTGSLERWEQSRWEADLVYIQNEALFENREISALGLNCPNCGAPIANLGMKFCEHCGTGIREINIHAWTFNALREA